MDGKHSAAHVLSIELYGAVWVDGGLSIYKIYNLLQNLIYTTSAGAILKRTHSHYPHDGQIKRITIFCLYNNR